MPASTERRLAAPARRPSRRRRRRRGRSRRSRRRSARSSAWPGDAPPPRGRAAAARSDVAQRPVALQLQRDHGGGVAQDDALPVAEPAIGLGHQRGLGRAVRPDGHAHRARRAALPAAGAMRRRRAIRRLQPDVRAGRVGRRGEDRVEPAPRQHQLDEPVLHREQPLQVGVAGVDDARHGRLRDRHERRLVRHGQQRQAQAARPPPPAPAGSAAWRSPTPKPRPATLARDQPLDVGGQHRRPRRRARARWSAAARRPPGTASGRRARPTPPSAPRGPGRRSPPRRRARARAAPRRRRR